MAITTTSAFNTLNVASGKTPIYVMAIAGQSTVYSTHDLTLSGVTSAPAFKTFLKTPTGPSQSISIPDGQSSLGELTCEVVDVDGTVSTLFGGTTLAGSTLTLYVGYAGTDFVADFVALHTFTIYKPLPFGNYTSWTITARDQQWNVKRTITANPYNGEALDPSNPWIIQGTPAEILQAILLFGLGLAVSIVNLASLQAIDSPAEGMYCATRPFLFTLTAAFDAKQWIETEILKVCGCYLIVDNLGRIAIKAPRASAAGIATSFTFTDDNMTVLPKFDRAPIVNSIVVDLPFDDPSGQADTKLLFEQATSLSQFSTADVQLAITSNGLQQNLGANAFLQGVADRIFRRFSGVAAGVGSLRGGAPIIGVEAFFMTLPVWTGDYVAVTSAFVPDLNTGARGVTNRVYEVVDRSPNYAGGKMSYKLLDTGLTGLAPAAVFGSGAGHAVIGTSTYF